MFEAAGARQNLKTRPRLYVDSMAALEYNRGISDEVGLIFTGGLRPLGDIITSYAELDASEMMRAVWSKIDVAVTHFGLTMTATGSFHHSWCLLSISISSLMQFDVRGSGMITPHSMKGVDFLGMVLDSMIFRTSDGANVGFGFGTERWVLAKHVINAYNRMIRERFFGGEGPTAPAVPSPY